MRCYDCGWPELEYCGDGVYECSECGAQVDEEEVDGEDDPEDSDL